MLKVELAVVVSGFCTRDRIVVIFEPADTAFCTLTVTVLPLKKQFPTDVVHVDESIMVISEGNCKTAKEPTTKLLIMVKLTLNWPMA